MGAGWAPRIAAFGTMRAVPSDRGVAFNGAAEGFPYGLQW